jgi:N-acetylglucosamine-6-phosphate deacetylase
MDRAFRNVVTSFGGSLVDAATVCSTSPARALGLSGFGVLSEGTAADLVVLDRSFHVVLTLIGGREAFRAH